jgi:hypothetical protein
MSIISPLVSITDVAVLPSIPMGRDLERVMEITKQLSNFSYFCHPPVPIANAALPFFEVRLLSIFLA